MPKKYFVCVLSGPLALVLGATARGDVVLQSAEAFVEANGIAGVAASAVTINERVDWDQLGSAFAATIDEQETIAGTFSGFDIDTTIDAFVTQDTMIFGVIGSGFSGVSSVASANGTIIERLPADGSNTLTLRTFFECAFLVEGPGVAFDLQGVLHSSATGPTAELTANIALQRFTDGGIPAETIIFSVNARPDPDFPFPFQEAGALTPGNWVLQLGISGNVPTATAPSNTNAAYSWDVDFTIVQPCPADLTGPAQDGIPDGTVDASDLTLYLDAYVEQFGTAGGGGPSGFNADITGPAQDGIPDGTVDASDLTLYLDRYIAGFGPCG